MGCDQPRDAWYSREFGRTGKRLITFNRNGSLNPRHVLKLPCGQCYGCRLEHSRQWAIRCMHEAHMHADNSFVTLTYEDKHLPPDGTLVRGHPQSFLKRLRTSIEPLRFRFYGCGEYGETTVRPHYHIILFGYDPPDKRYYGPSKNGDPLYTSQSINKVWGMGECKIGDVTFESCAYVARYVTGKMTGDMADDWYAGRLPEFSMMSRRGGIGLEWFRAYGEHAYFHDSVIMRNREMRPPRFYDTKYELMNPEHLREIKQKRKRMAVAAGDNTSQRRHTKEDVLRLNLQRRSL